MALKYRSPKKKSVVPDITTIEDCCKEQPLRNSLKLLVVYSSDAKADVSYLMNLLRKDKNLEVLILS